VLLETVTLGGMGDRAPRARDRALAGASRELAEDLAQPDETRAHHGVAAQRAARRVDRGLRRAGIEPERLADDELLGGAGGAGRAGRVAGARPPPSPHGRWPSAPRGRRAGGGTGRARRSTGAPCGDPRPGSRPACRTAPPPSLPPRARGRWRSRRAVPGIRG